MKNKKESKQEIEERKQKEFQERMKIDIEKMFWYINPPIRCYNPSNNRWLCLIIQTFEWHVYESEDMYDTRKTIILITDEQEAIKYFTIDKDTGISDFSKND